MAILGDIEVKVLVNDQSTQEYEDDENETRDPNLVIQYIEAISSAAFAIKISVPSHYEFTSDAISFDIMLDGRRATDRLLAKVKHSKDGPWEQTVAGVTKNGLHGGNLKPFLFSEVARGMCKRQIHMTSILTQRSRRIFSASQNEEGRRTERRWYRRR